MQSLLRTWADPDTSLQAPFAAAVVMPTILRPSLFHALLSVFRQDLPGGIQVLVGLDTPGDPAVIEAACAHRPPGCVVQLLWPGYSTSVRHGGLCAARDGGVLRCVLTHLANSPYVAYLDDDNWWDPAHLSSLHASLDGGAADWAYSLRWFIRPDSLRPICIDGWESVGPGRGLFEGGFVDTNCLMIDKRACASAIDQWTRPMPADPKGMSADRRVFAALLPRRRAETGRASCFYRIDPADEMHPWRLARMGEAWAQAA